MLHYPKIPGSSAAPVGRCVAFDKLDGTNLHWCWDRDARRVQDVSLGYYLEDVDPLFIYRGHTSHNRYFYEYRAGYKNSGYISDRQARFENCVPTPSGQVCLGSTYPRNITRAHDNGTWSWNTY